VDSDRRTALPTFGSSKQVGQASACRNTVRSLPRHSVRQYPFDRLKPALRDCAQGIGPLEGQTIRLAGLHGGGLLRCGQQGWTVEELPLDWPDVSLLLVEPWQSIYVDSAHFTKLAVEREVRAFGFSETGRSLVLATGSDVAVYGA
jgi:hypothetical protein